ncbi:hypothetical protein [Mesorhizobium sp. NBSH29]|uniref:hypothetical protein n=1 Tax=Mesorhizobium sp. NBSH29 TaxID=2654249 RepID=UPI0018966C71|nr:hypothetical protein [Mesorhizobium sp. NBSH29]
MTLFLILAGFIALWSAQAAAGAHRTAMRDIRRTCPTLCAGDNRLRVWLGM